MTCQLEVTCVLLSAATAPCPGGVACRCCWAQAGAKQEMNNVVIASASFFMRNDLSGLGRRLNPEGFCPTGCRRNLQLRMIKKRLFSLIKA